MSIEKKKKEVKSNKVVDCVGVAEIGKPSFSTCTSNNRSDGGHGAPHGGVYMAARIKSLKICETNLIEQRVQGWMHARRP